MDKKRPISEIMATRIKTISPEQMMQEVEEIFEFMPIRFIPVIKNEIVVGVISKSDYLSFKRLYNNDSTEDRMDLFRLKNFKVSDVMTRNFTSIKSSESLQKALDIFNANEIHGLPVIDDYKLVGVLTTNDIIKYFAKV